MQIITPETRLQIAEDTSALYDMYAESVQNQQAFSDERLVCFVAIKAAIFEQPVLVTWPFNLDADMAERGIVTHYSDLGPRIRHDVGYTALKHAGELTLRTRTVPREMHVLRECIEQLRN